MAQMTESISAPVPSNTTKDANCAPTRQTVSPSVAQSIQQRYADERSKRQRADGLLQYVNPSSSRNPRLKRLLDDPWDDGSVASITLKDDMCFKVVIMGAGFGGLLFAVRLLETGCFRSDEIVLIDVAAGFGGTWYWNRYPGLTCDVESYIYMPLLEETGYIPRYKYASGEELREHANRIAAQWSLEHRAMFRTLLNKCSWSDDATEWVLEMTQFPPTGRNGTRPQPFSATVRAHFVILAPGLLNKPKIANVPGLSTFQGSSFLASRWDYNVTGGSQEAPALINLQDKRVGIIGTGATAVQAVPQLAKWSRELYVFQRTPAPVDFRRQRKTDLAEWSQGIATAPGWQQNRIQNFISFTAYTQPLPPVDMVADAWTSFPTFHVLTGGGSSVSAEGIPAHIAKMHALDLPRSERIRTRVQENVHDRAVAEQLKPWYPGWCKRPCFNDEYLGVFNRPNVRLVDTNGKGVQAITATGMVANNAQFDLDVLIFATGFELGVLDSPGARSGISVFGRAGRSLDEKWSREPLTLHGIATHGFPNMFFSSSNQAGVAPTYTSTLDTFAKHVAFILSESTRHQNSGKAIIEPTQAAETAWGMRVLAGAAARAPVVGCTPSYFNAEGSMEDVSIEEQRRLAISGPWPDGLNDFMNALDEWRKTGDFCDFHLDIVC
ncbi:flavin-containing monooxygenase [Aspergillus clavatus NRRL 1]|uniref:Monooxygenase n=1 Tax=Aspergillus clavatus (strain ATCC 1007 / CBS 513.65 / DSM 816 / NCTC 3887 / NRRL 1 / QM 1276 / 107) TaxID=344612 RepID=A1CSG1_ASPCL|nr:monooxygenase [Aspergillus clavatus NRRL 1]EAW08582.1 monooxygenase [Aspergillus clavatus NRRL 1]